MGHGNGEKLFLLGEKNFFSRKGAKAQRSLYKRGSAFAPLRLCVSSKEAPASFHLTEFTTWREISAQ
jgi:hypothetical protein